MKSETIEIHPNVKKNILIVSTLCILFTLGGFWILFSGEHIFEAILVIALFGGGGIYTIPKLLRRKVPLALTPEGLEQHYEEGSVLIHWSDIEKIGVVTIFSNQMVGIRLKNYDRYLGEMSPSLAAYFKKTLPYLKAATKATSLIETPKVVEDRAKREGHDLEDELKSFGKIKNIEGGLEWSREQYGYDITIGKAELDRPITDFIALLEEYRASAKQE